MPCPFVAPGISPIMLDDLTSGFNIAENISTEQLVNELLGFTNIEMEMMLDSLVPGNRDLLLVLKNYYNGYLFSEHSVERMYNPNMVLFYLQQYLRYGTHPHKIIDENVKTDYGRLNLLIPNQENRKTLLKVIGDEEICSDLITQFSFNLMYDTSNFVSLLFYLGMLTIKGTQYGMIVFGIPNYVIKIVYWDYIKLFLQREYQIKYDTAEIQKTIWQLAYEGQVEPYLRFVSEKIIKVLSNRDLIAFDEKYLKVLLLSFLVLGNFYKPYSEKEVENGYIDLFLEKDLRYPDVKYEWLWELKYLKEKDRERLEEVKTQGLAQLQRYAKSEKFRDRNLRKVLIVFIGKGEYCVYEG